MREAPEHVRDAAGEVVAGHRVVALLRQEVGRRTFSAETPDGEPVVLQVVSLPHYPDAADGFLDAAERLRELGHPGLPDVRAAGRSDDGLWIATAPFDGVGLHRLVEGGIGPLRAVRLLGEVADALDAAHAAGVVHGDVRPGNVAVQERPVEHPRLVDFDLLGLTAGTAIPAERAPYAAPELFRDEKPSKSTDVYALACVLGECIAGAPPYGRERIPARRGHLDGRVPALASAGVEVPTAFDQALARGLAKDPAARPASAAELMGDAARALIEASSRPALGSGEPADASPRARSATASTPRRRGALVAGLTALAVAVAGAVGFAAGSSADRGDPPTTTAAGPVTVPVPRGWAASGEGGGDRPALVSASRLVEGGGGTIAAGPARDRAAVLDPTRLAGEIVSRPPRPDVVRLPGGTALRWTGLESRDGSRVTLYAMSTSAGAIAVTCSKAAAACAEAAGGLRLRSGTRAYDPTAGIAWKARLATVTRRLSERRAARLRRLRRARTPGGQGRQAASLARAYSAAQRELGATATPPQAARSAARVAGRLRALQRGYRSLGRSARRGSRRAYSRARARIRAADTRLRATLHGL